MIDESSCENHGLFYLELPQADYLSDIEIQDEYEDPACEERQGLSDEQVSAIALDSLNAAKEQMRMRDANDQTLIDK